MPLEIQRDLWLCVDCTIVAVNGDYSGIETEERVAEVDAGFERLAKEGHASANFDSETEDGIRDFSSCGCDCCGSRLAGTMHRFAILGEPELCHAPMMYGVCRKVKGHEGKHDRKGTT